MAAEAEASREARAKVTKDFVFQLLSCWLSWKDLVNKFPTAISLLAANTRFKLPTFFERFCRQFVNQGGPLSNENAKHSPPLKPGENKYNLLFKVIAADGEMRASKALRWVL